ncbi:hypothetical protein Y032_0010g955 [Ancylostoma ceylanicum]|uniref:Transthyretin-like family protein n=1 Tax=Ancylostoma ceylanicum TaxID=53326 RepID=A0A016VIC0_9BILA|nr:hypothetical protein Y032_0010g955 [Ancylostoma ceylanicum]
MHLAALKIGASGGTMALALNLGVKIFNALPQVSKGSERELTTIDPVFKVYHDCDDGLKPGQRKVKFRIPKSYISAGGIPKRIFNIGVLNLETIFAKEERDLI